ncbi:ATP-binding protein [Schnuerera sp. xch1]|uniref:nucleotide-binding protein n=1 Tax=Schnuerera sp. xch1 TaxID=2874283 RepID=UPI001CC016F7|nr:ATP-binding protein [Schnuerera sp. xch1]
MIINDKRLRIIVGHYGSGKTEFSVNYAIKLAEKGKKVALGDLDIVNLYFRSREKTEELKKLGVKVISSSIKGSGVDIPAISAEIITPMQDKTYEAVLDVGGDPAGARTLGRYFQYFVEGQYDMFFVLNANRPETQTVAKSIEYMKKIEYTARAKVTGIINNTHMLKSTTIDDVLMGQELVEKISEKTDIPVKYVVALEDVARELPSNLEGEIFPIKLYMREEWMV